MDAKQINLINAAYSAIPELRNGFVDAKRDLFNQFATEERKYRQNRTVPGFSAVMAAKLAVAQWLVRYATGAYQLPTIGDYLTIRPAVFYAAALAAVHRDEIIRSLTHFAIDIPALLAIDYARLMEAA